MKKKLSIEPNTKNISDLCKTFQEKFYKSVSEAAPSSDCDLKKVPFRSSSLGLPWRPLRTKTDKGPLSSIKGDKEPPRREPFVIQSKMKKKNKRGSKKIYFFRICLSFFSFCALPTQHLQSSLQSAPSGKKKQHPSGRFPQRPPF